MAGWFAGRLAPAPVSQSRAPLVAGAPDSGHGRNDMVSNPVPDFRFSGFQCARTDTSSEHPPAPAYQPRTEYYHDRAEYARTHNGRA